jgi:hypothetical protein
LPETSLSREYFPRKGAKAQSAAAFLEGFLCAFAPLREKLFSAATVPDAFEYFSGKPLAL